MRGCQIKDEKRIIDQMALQFDQLDDDKLNGLEIEDYNRLKKLAKTKYDLAVENRKRLLEQLSQVEEMPQMLEDVRDRLVEPVRTAETTEALHAALQRVFLGFKLSIFRPGGWPVSDKVIPDPKLADSPVHPPKIETDADFPHTYWLHPILNPDAAEWVKGGDRFPVASGVFYEEGGTLDASKCAPIRTRSSIGLNGLVM